jgi:aminoglycoside phosphotransferase (APT) family kinase protein
LPLNVPPTTAERRRPLTASQLERLGRAIDPRATVAGARPLLGGVDTATYALRLARDDDMREVVVRVYRGWDDAAATAKREYAALAAVSHVVALAPTPLLMDPDGDLIGEALIVMTFLPGAPLPPLAPDDAWAEQLADALIAVHATPIERLSADFPRAGSAAERLARNVERGAGERDPLWHTVVAALRPVAADVTANAATLIHSDFWFGNTLWQDGRLTGIVDWDGARIDDPALDVAIARNDLALLSGADLADVFLARYERARGRLRDLAFWDALSCLAPIRFLPHWVEGYSELGLDLPLATARARLESWIASALRRLEE